MSILRYGSVATVWLTVALAAMPAMAQFSPQAGRIYGHTPASGNVVIGGNVQVGTPSSLIINNRGGYYPDPTTPTVIIIQQPTMPAYYPQSYCTTSVIGSPIPTPYARDSVTGAVCH